MKLVKRQRGYKLKVHHKNTMLSAFKWWLSKENKHCGSFCPLCEYYFLCQEDVEANKLLEGK